MTKWLPPPHHPYSSRSECSLFWFPFSILFKIYIYRTHLFVDFSFPIHILLSIIGVCEAPPLDDCHGLCEGGGGEEQSHDGHQEQAGQHSGPHYRPQEQCHWGEVVVTSGLMQ